MLLAACGGGGSDTPRPPPNSAPALTTTAFSATEDTAFAGQLTATDVENNVLAFERINNVQHGQITVSTSGAVAYIPAPNYFGADTFSVRVTDGAGGATTGTVTINVAGVNDAPTFTSPSPPLSTNEDVVLNSQMGTYASDPDGNTLTFAVVTAPAHGALTLLASGAATYLPVANYNGTDSWSVRVTDGNGGEATGSVSVTIAAVNDSPVLTTTQFGVSEDAVLTAQLAATDVENQAVQFRVSGSATHGQASITQAGLLTYTPNANYFGTDSLTVGMSDDGVTLTSAPVTITINPVNDAPVAAEDLLRVPASSASVTLPVIDNDIDVDGDALTVTILSQPGGGTLSVGPGNTLTFARDNEFNGPIRFRYRITDAAGVTSDADVRAVIGDFPGIYYLSDETTVGQQEVHWFDGLRVYRLGLDLNPGESIGSFSMAGDGSKVAYDVGDANFSRVRITGPNASDAPVIFTSAARAPGSIGLVFQLNRNGTYLLVTDPNTTPWTLYMVRTSDGLKTRVGANTPQVAQLANYFAFSPTNDDFYLQVQVSGSPPPTSGTGYLTLFRGNSASAATLTQVGATYPAPSGGAGSGNEIAITSDGRYVLHREITFSPIKSSILVYDSVTNTESPAYRRPVVNEIGMWGAFALSNDGSRVCFGYREADGGGSSGPGRFVAGSPGAPANIAPVTPVFFLGGNECRFSPDNHTMFYRGDAAAQDQVLLVDSASPGTPVAISRPVPLGQSLDNWWVARDAPRLMFATYTGSQRDFYSTSLTTPGSFITFATNVFDDGSLPGSLDRNGFVFAYSKRPAPFTGLRRLTLLSTQSANYSFSLTRPETTTGLLQYQWAP